MDRTRLLRRRREEGSAFVGADHLPATLKAHWFLLNNKKSKLVSKRLTGSFLVCVSGDEFQRRISPAHTSVGQVRPAHIITSDQETRNVRFCLFSC